MGTLTPHLVTRDPAVAAAWYGEVLGAIEEGRTHAAGRPGAERGPAVRRQPAGDR